MMMYEYLRDAEMKKKLKVNIRKGAKIHPPPIRLQRPESKKGFALAPPPRQSPSKRAILAADSIDSPDDSIPSFANFSDALDNIGDSQAFDLENMGPQAKVVDIEVDRPYTSSSFPGEAEGEAKENKCLAQSACEVTFSDLLSTKVKRSAAAAIIRGPPAARHFGGNRGGLLSEHVNFGSKCDGGE
jgi:hypothetical protein